MKTVIIDLGDDLPVYRQIADQLRVLVARGELAEGEVLPSVRELGASLGVNLNTVARAYRVLAEEGLVRLEQGKPARVAGRGDAARRPPKPRRLEAILSEWVLAGAGRGAIESAVHDVLDRFFDDEPRVQET